MFLKQNNELNYQNLYIPDNKILCGGKRINNRSTHKDYFFSIITVVLNNEYFLERTIKSVINQGIDVEYILIDGGSTDGTLNIIKKYEKFIDLWISEKDFGIYDAMNKGIKYSTGNYIGMVNSSDLYNNNALLTIKDYFTQNKKIDFVFGTVHKKLIKSGFKRNKIYWSFDFYPSHSSGFFISNRAQKKIGLYDINFKLSADYDFFFRLIKSNFKGIATKKKDLIGYFMKDGGSFSSSINYYRQFEEEVNIRLNNKQNIFSIIFVILLNYLMKFIKKKKSISIKECIHLIKICIQN
jgi:glycosyltransferase involved in cell wall biosynthesis